MILWLHGREEKINENCYNKKIRPKSLAVSNNFKFGRNRKGNVNLLKKFGKKFKIMTSYIQSVVE